MIGFMGLQLERIKCFWRKIQYPNYAVSNEMKFAVVSDKFWHGFNKGSWEPDTVKFYRNHVSPDKDVIDIGGYIGATMMLAYSFNPNKIYVIEADPANYQILKKNTFNNYLDDKVELFNICVADKSDEIVSFGYAYDNIFDMSAKNIGGDRVKVRTTVLEDFLKTRDMTKVNIIKIDIEGGEQYIEKGLDYIAEFSGIIILLSIHTPFWKDKRETANMLIKQFKKYDVYSSGEKIIPEEELMTKMLCETPTKKGNRTGLFFTLILKTKEPLLSQRI